MYKYPIPYPSVLLGTKSAWTWTKDRKSKQITIIRLSPIKPTNQFNFAITHTHDLRIDIMQRNWCVDQVPLPSVLINNYLEQQHHHHQQQQHHQQSQQLQHQLNSLQQQQQQSLTHLANSQSQSQSLSYQQQVASQLQKRQRVTTTNNHHHHQQQQQQQTDSLALSNSNGHGILFNNQLIQASGNTGRLNSSNHSSAHRNEFNSNGSATNSNRQPGPSSQSHNQNSHSQQQQQQQQQQQRARNGFDLSQQHSLSASSSSSSSSTSSALPKSASKQSLINNNRFAPQQSSATKRKLDDIIEFYPSEPSTNGSTNTNTSSLVSKQSAKFLFNQIKSENIHNPALVPSSEANQSNGKSSAASISHQASQSKQAASSSAASMLMATNIVSNINNHQSKAFVMFMCVLDDWVRDEGSTKRTFGTKKKTGAKLRLISCAFLIDLLFEKGLWLGIWLKLDCG